MSRNGKCGTFAAKTTAKTLKLNECAGHLRFQSVMYKEMNDVERASCAEAEVVLLSEGYI